MFKKLKTLFQIESLQNGQTKKQLKAKKTEVR